jgi:hypothetical protein
MAAAWPRLTAGLAAFLLVSGFGVLVLREIDPDRAADSWSLVTLLAIPAGVAVYALVELLQTGRLDSIARQFDTRTLVLMPVAIAINIVLGTAVASALKIPVYLDSVGTVLVAALAGPLAGALTGLLSNLVWTYLAPPPFSSPYAAPFALVAVIIGLLAGAFARWGWLRPRPGASGRDLEVGTAVAVGILAVLAVLALGVWQVASRGTELAPQSDETLFVALGWLALLLVIGTGVGLLILLVRRRDLAAAYLVVAGAITGVTAAVVAAPIAASLFGGVTGSGADFLIAAFRQAGASLQQAVLTQSLVSDSIDKVVTFFVVYIVLGAVAVRTLVRFPQGPYLVPRAPESPADGGRAAARDDGL